LDLPDSILGGTGEVDGRNQTEAAAGGGCAFGFGCEVAQSGQICRIAEIADGAKGGKAQGDVPDGHQFPGYCQNTRIIELHGAAQRHGCDGSATLGQAK
jgi:hypothetical protein